MLKDGCGPLADVAQRGTAPTGSQTLPGSIGLLLVSVFTAAAQLPPAHFHHIHLNATDPAAAIAFYTNKFDCEKAKFAGEWDGVWAQKVWILFDKVANPPSSAITSGIWHFGWGAEDMKAEYQKQVASGTKFNTPITDISDLANYPGFFYAYVDGPDHALIELNTASHHHLGHVHLLSADPIAAGEWYMKYLGAIRDSKEPLSRAGVLQGLSGRAHDVAHVGQCEHHHFSCGVCSKSVSGTMEESWSV